MNIYNFPILYKIQNSKIRFWKIYVVENKDKTAEIYTEYGIENGKITKHSPQIIKKSIGQTSCFERAIKLANTKWKNKKTTDLFYEDKDVNKKEIFRPMKPANFEKYESSITYPAYIQPKLDGFRLFSFLKNGKVFALSRQQKEMNHIPKIKKNLEILLKKYPQYIFDGEIIGKNISLKDLKSILSKKEANDTDKLKRLKYYVFDLIDKNNLDLPFEERINLLKKILKKYSNIVIVPTFIVNNKKEVDLYVKKYKNNGYEGIMIRNKEGIYKYNSFSKDVQKIKLYDVDEFKIVGFDEGSGNDKGTVIWIVECLKNPDKKFRVRPKGTREERKYYYNNARKYMGKKINIYYFEKDNDGCVVRIKTGEIKK